MKTFTVVILVMLLFVALAAPALAQDGTPDTAVGFLTLLTGLTTAWIGGGAIGSFLTNLLKTLTWIPEQDRSRISGTGAEFMAAVLTTAVAVVVQYVLPLFQYLDTAGIWPIVLAIVAATPAAFVGKLTYKLSK